jgi:hypothetical protein
MEMRIMVSEMDLVLAQTYGIQTSFHEMHSTFVNDSTFVEGGGAAASSSAGPAAAAAGSVTEASAGPAAAAAGSVTEGMRAQETLIWWQQRAYAALYDGCGSIIPGAIPALRADIFVQKGVNVAEVCDILERTTTANGAASAYAAFLTELQGITFDEQTKSVMKKAKDAIRVTAVLRCACESDPRNGNEFLIHLWNAFSVMLDNPEVWQAHDGCITNGSTMFEAQMSIDEAKARCAILRGCCGFTWEEGNVERLHGAVVMIYFKTFKESKGPKIINGFQGQHWLSYTWKVPDLWTQLKCSWHKDIDQSNMNPSNRQLEAGEIRGDLKRPQDSPQPKRPQPKRASAARLSAAAAAAAAATAAATAEAIGRGIEPAAAAEAIGRGIEAATEHERPRSCRDSSRYCDLSDIKIETLVLLSNGDDSRGLRLILSEESKSYIWRPMQILLRVLTAIPGKSPQELETVVKCVMSTLQYYFGDGGPYRLAPEFEQVLRGTHRWGSPASAPLPARVLERPLYVPNSGRHFFII